MGQAKNWLAQMRVSQAGWKSSIGYIMHLNHFLFVDLGYYNNNIVFIIIIN
ncbi:hypothetical protein HanRHA438_Chr14g0639211 [Helianthus annuus]|nr:hypothetical protein HanHA300_Chr14g0512961 [Helianthus annuus]KAJ0484582.1 hypothetical protein HanHA89_Chr14g0558421 [Helianthus annuus]KAJ0655134.1 hypothetical protein HanLR1_Chr14g0520691 [Helianthus annuus]KAJ0658842.1 hypothetical protein HanOQP8_Chr14g0519181 [Helianthus annuus]KAJ0852390.1 hypothetical protein HanRHA438_Chr14g0639211 [Helianthus annuus]